MNIDIFFFLERFSQYLHKITVLLFSFLFCFHFVFYFLFVLFFYFGDRSWWWWDSRHIYTGHKGNFWSDVDWTTTTKTYHQDLNLGLDFSMDLASSICIFFMINHCFAFLRHSGYRQLDERDWIHLYWKYSDLFLGESLIFWQCLDSLTRQLGEELFLRFLHWFDSDRYYLKFHQSKFDSHHSDMNRCEEVSDHRNLVY